MKQCAAQGIEGGVIRLAGCNSVAIHGLLPLKALKSGRSGDARYFYGMELLLPTKVVPSAVLARLRSPAVHRQCQARLKVRSPAASPARRASSLAARGTPRVFPLSKHHRVLKQSGGLCPRSTFPIVATIRTMVCRCKPRFIHSNGRRNFMAAGKIVAGISDREHGSGFKRSFPRRISARCRCHLHLGR